MAENTLVDINESVDIASINLPDLPDSEDSDFSDKSVADSPTERHTSMASRLSDEDINQIALKICLIMVPDIQAMIDKSIGDLTKHYDTEIMGVKFRYHQAWVKVNK